MVVSLQFSYLSDQLLLSVIHPVCLSDSHLQTKPSQCICAPCSKIKLLSQTGLVNYLTYRQYQAYLLQLGAETKVSGHTDQYLPKQLRKFL